MIGTSSASPLVRSAACLAFMILPLLASPLSGQDGCRGWAASCAAVEVRADASGERLILFAPNLRAVSEEEAAAGPDEERLSIRSAGVPSATDGTGGTTADDPGYMACDDAREWEAAARGLEEDEEAECDGPPVGALFLLALPASLYVLGPDGDDPTVLGPDDPFPNPPASSPGAEDGGDGGDEGAGQGPGDDGTYDDDGASDDGDDGASDDGDDGAGADDSGDDVSDDGGATGSRDETGGNGGDDGGTSGGDDGGTSGGGGDGAGNNGGGSPGPDDPYHPDVDDLPPISQVPEPISTTLFGLGLAGYAGVRLRRRRGGPEDGAPTA